VGKAGFPEKKHYQLNAQSVVILIGIFPERVI